MTAHREPRPFTSALSEREMILVFLWLPAHLWLLPEVLTLLISNGTLTESTANLVLYAAGAVYMLAVAFPFLRRDFDPLCDRPLDCALRIARCYLAMMGCNLCLSAVLTLIESVFRTSLTGNPNNAAVIDLAGQDISSLAAMAVFLAPITEEMLFRAAVFRLLYRRSRRAAYAVSMVMFSLYHVWSYAVQDPFYWIYLLQYLPASYLLCRCYEKSDSIWCSIFFHMLVNGVSVRILMLLQELL